MEAPRPPVATQAARTAIAMEAARTAVVWEAARRAIVREAARAAVGEDASRPAVPDEAKFAVHIGSAADAAERAAIQSRLYRFDPSFDTVSIGPAASRSVAVITYSDSADHSAARRIAAAVGQLGYAWRIERTMPRQPASSARAVELWFPNHRVVVSRGQPRRMPPGPPTDGADRITAAAKEPPQAAPAPVSSNADQTDCEVRRTESTGPCQPLSTGNTTRL